MNRFSEAMKSDTTNRGDVNPDQRKLRLNHDRRKPRRFHAAFAMVGALVLVAAGCELTLSDPDPRGGMDVGVQLSGVEGQEEELEELDSVLFLWVYPADFIEAAAADEWDDYEEDELDGDQDDPFGGQAVFGDNIVLSEEDADAGEASITVEDLAAGDYHLYAVGVLYEETEIDGEEMPVAINYVGATYAETDQLVDDEELPDPDELDDPVSVTGDGTVAELELELVEGGAD